MIRNVREKFTPAHDVLRHTYISMLVGKFRSVGDAALQAGNSEAVIRKYYLDVKSVAEAEKFWNVRPAAVGHGTWGKPARSICRESNRLMSRNAFEAADQPGSA